MDRIKCMRAKLEAALAPTHLEIQDDSHKHIGHVGAQNGAGHYTVVITSQEFSHKTLLQRHRLVYAALGEMMQTDIHALQIIAQDR